jgi:hypothetical protein
MGRRRPLSSRGALGFCLPLAVEARTDGADDERETDAARRATELSRGHAAMVARIGRSPSSAACGNATANPSGFSRTQVCPAERWPKKNDCSGRT